MLDGKEFPSVPNQNSEEFLWQISPHQALFSKEREVLVVIPKRHVVKEAHGSGNNRFHSVQPGVDVLLPSLPGNNKGEGD